VIAIVAGALLLLALVDGACAGFRSSAGRTGLIDHRSADRHAGRRGGTLVAILLSPAMALTCIVVIIDPASTGPYLRAGKIMLAVYAPYALAVLAALAVFATLDWRKRYLASAVILGPFTFIRPALVVTGAVIAIATTRNIAVAITTVLAVIAVLTTEPGADRLWYAPRARS
jgi:hypothetical protein